MKRSAWLIVDAKGHPVLGGTGSRAGIRNVYPTEPEAMLFLDRWPEEPEWRAVEIEWDWKP